MRLKIHGAINLTGIGRTIEEACAIFGEAAVRSSHQKDPKEEIINYLRFTYRTKIDFEAAILIQNEFQNLPKEIEHESQERIKTAIQNTENQLSGRNYSVPKYRSAAGIAFPLFVINEFDIERTMREMLVATTDQILPHLSTALREDTEGKLKELIITTQSSESSRKI